MVILDTHAWILYVTESTKLSLNAYKEINQDGVCGISAISCWEIAMLVEKMRIEFSIPIEKWLKLALMKVHLIPLTPEISIISSRLNPFHGDPADRIICATAKFNNSYLIS